MRYFAIVLIFLSAPTFSQNWVQISTKCTSQGGIAYSACKSWVFSEYGYPFAKVEVKYHATCASQTPNTASYCYGSNTVSCEAGYFWDESVGECVDENAPCPQGQLKFNGVCADVGECDTGEDVVLDPGQSLLQACDGAQQCDEGFYWHSATQSCYGPDDQGSSSSDSSSSDSSTSDSSSSDGSTSSSGGSTSSGSGGSTSSGSDLDLSEVVSELNEANSTLDDISSDTGSIKDTLDSWDESDTMPTYTDPGVTSFSEANQNFYNRVSSSQLLTSFNNVSNYLDLSGASCQPLTIDLTNTIIGTVVSSDIMCQLFNQYGGILAAAFMAVYVFAAFRIVAGA